MSFSSLLTRTATVELWNSTSVNDLNDEVIGYGPPVDYPAWFNSLPLSESAEITVGRDVGVITDLLVLPAGAVIDHLSRVTRDDGAVFQVVGPPDRVHTPRGEHHVEARLKAIVEGGS